MSGRTALFALLTCVALVGAGCSSGGGNAALVLCPPNAPVKAEIALQAGAHGLSGKLVPFRALNVRFCKYAVPVGYSTTQRLAASDLLSSKATAQFESETNALANDPRPDNSSSCPGGPGAFYLMTFATRTQHVDVFIGGCTGYVSNGILSSQPLAKSWNLWTHWYSTLQQDTRRPSKSA